jgi:hypothetical protein
MPAVHRQFVRHRQLLRCPGTRSRSESGDPRDLAHTEDWRRIPLRHGQSNPQELDPPDQALARLAHRRLQRAERARMAEVHQARRTGRHDASGSTLASRPERYRPRKKSGGLAAYDVASSQRAPARTGDREAVHAARVGRSQCLLHWLGTETGHLDTECRRWFPSGSRLAFSADMGCSGRLTRHSGKAATQRQKGSATRNAAVLPKPYIWCSRQACSGKASTFGHLTSLPLPAEANSQGQASTLCCGFL